MIGHDNDVKDMFIIKADPDINKCNVESLSFPADDMKVQYIDSLLSTAVQKTKTWLWLKEREKEKSYDDDKSMQLLWW